MLDYKIIGAGGFGKVYSTPQGNVIKAIYSSDVCGDAHTEYIKQSIAYEVLNNIKNIKFTNKVIDFMKDRIVVSKPISSHIYPVTVAGQEFSCYFTMELLHGIPLWMYENIDPIALKKVAPEFMLEKGNNFEIMTHLSLNTDIGGRFYGINYSKSLISDKNPPRGYFITETGDFLALLRSSYGLTFDGTDDGNLNDQAKELIGFIYGILFFHANLIPFDVEITLGYYSDIFKVNVLDFGLTVDLNDIEHAPKHFHTTDVLEILNSNRSEVEKSELIEKAVLSQLAIDLYCDVESDDHCIRGWELARSTMF